MRNNYSSLHEEVGEVSQPTLGERIAALEVRIQTLENAISEISRKLDLTFHHQAKAEERWAIQEDWIERVEQLQAQVSSLTNVVSRLDRVVTQIESFVNSWLVKLVTLALTGGLVVMGFLSLGKSLFK